MKKQDKGWSSETQIANAINHTCGVMICKKCKEKITTGEYLIVNHFNIYHRGNETDWGELFHKECSLNRKAWKDYENKLKKDAIEKERHLAEVKQKAIAAIQKSEDVSFSTDEYGDDCILY